MKIRTERTEYGGSLYNSAGHRIVSSKDMKENYDNHKPAFRDNVVTLGGLLTFCILGTVQLLTRETLTCVHQMFLVLSGIAIPLLATSVSIHYLELPYQNTRRPWYVWACIGIGIATGLAAIITCFFSLHWLAGTIAALTCGIGLAVMWFFIDELKDANPDDFKEEESETSM